MKETVLPRTRRWEQDEFMIVDGLNMVYTAAHNIGDTIVHLPGGINLSVDRLIAQGRRVTPPKVMRA